MSGARLVPAMGVRAVLDRLREGALPVLAARAAALRRVPPGLVRLAPGLLALLAAMALFLALGPGGTARRVSAAALAVAAQVRAEDEVLHRELRRPPAAPAAPAAPVPQRFLRDVVAAAAASGLRITRLAPVQHAEALELEASGRFPELLRFATEVELARGALRGLRVRTAPGDGALELAVTLDPPGGVAASAAQASLARAALAAAPRDPFAVPQAPLASAHRLTGITVLDGGALMATIDGRDYRDGDALGGGVLRGVGPDWAELAQDGRLTRLRLAGPR